MRSETADGSVARFGHNRTNRQPLRIYLLGGFDVVAGDERVPSDAWRSRKAAQVIKRLALSPDQSLLRDQLIDVLWPDAGISSVGNSLRQVLHLARRD